MVLDGASETDEDSGSDEEKLESKIPIGEMVQNLDNVIKGML